MVLSKWKQTMIKERLKNIVEKAFVQASRDGKMGGLSECPEPIIIERPKLPEHGDLACGVALKLARHAKSSPVAIANTLAEYIKTLPEAQNGCISNFEVANPGFINFRLGKSWLADVIHEVHAQKSNYGRELVGENKRVLIEYVSANPTGSLHIGHGRNAVFGSCLANLFAFAGYKVEQEFYVNDAGAQIAALGECALAAYQRKLGQSVDYPEGGYPEESLSEYIDIVIERNGDKYLALSGDEAILAVGNETKCVIQKAQEDLLEKLGVKFERWFSEESLHKAHKVDQAMAVLASNNHSYEADGALWLKSKELGDERDRVLRKSSGDYTYLANDAAYHLDKFNRGYDLMVNIWGADHHGQVPGLKAIVTALGFDPKKLEVVLTQIVNLNRDGKAVRMSKRRGTVVMLDEVMDEVGVDAVRYYLAESNPNNPINFDLELAKKQSKDNPAFYLQYAHARCCSILRRALEPVKDLESGELKDPVVTEQMLTEWENEYAHRANLFLAGFEEDEAKFGYQKSLVMRLEALPQEVREAATSWQPGRLASFGYEVAKDLMKTYEESRVITADLSVTKARLGLIMATRQVLANVLKIIGVSAPERM
ncbi:MAG: arginine--tRNA ligase [Candidatus Obscuribacterales bacterium]|nr:arginine--tRNA ligase [Candidatus Obscuribacterales bacterium]